MSVVVVEAVIVAEAAPTSFGLGSEREFVM